MENKEIVNKLLELLDDNQLQQLKEKILKKETVEEADARADKLMKDLRQFARENNKERIDWGDRTKRKYCFYCEGKK